ncbi:serine/threonine-protein phosphatase 6 regulatory ankyrin repeat subunit B-like [Cloeon dipterum]|uniref:serine/threonine-protein phosphatase 6 regulatory ankyrin repeat subunit B-like n=1 Tax=Cloeon dipterum TaxID=197152 RepID=UPI00321FC0C3
MAADIMDHLIKSMSDLPTSYDVHKNSFIKNTQTKTPLQVAAAIDGVDTCRRLVADGAAINAKCQDFNATAMHYAALNEKHGLEVIEYFTSLKMRVDTKDKNGKEPIFYAIRAKNFKIAEKLLKLMFPKGELSKNNLLHICVKINNLEMAKIVHSNDKGLLNKYGEHGRSTIHVAAFYADLEMCKWLLSEGADVRALTENENEQNVLHCAAYNTSHGTELVQFFVSNFDFDVKAKDKLDFTPLHKALFRDNIKTAEELMKLGADLTAKRVTNDSNNLENLMHCCKEPFLFDFHEFDDMIKVHSMQQPNIKI